MNKKELLSRARDDRAVIGKSVFKVHTRHPAFCFRFISSGTRICSNFQAVVEAVAMQESTGLFERLTVGRLISILRSSMGGVELANTIEAKVLELAPLFAADSVQPDHPAAHIVVDQVTRDAHTTVAAANQVISSSYFIEEAVSPALDTTDHMLRPADDSPGVPQPAEQEVQPGRKARKRPRHKAALRGRNSTGDSDDDENTSVERVEEETVKKISELCSRPLMLMQRLGDLPMLPAWERRSAIAALWASLRDPFEGLSDRDVVELRNNSTLFADIFDWTKSPDLTRGKTFSHLGRIISSTSGVSIALAIADALAKPPENGTITDETATAAPSSSQLRSSRSSGSTPDVVKTALRSKGFDMEEIVKSRSDFYRAAAAGKLLREFPGLQQIGIQSVVTLGERASSVRDIIRASPWLERLLQEPIPRPTAGSCFIDGLKGFRPGAFCTTMIQSMWEPQDVDGVERWFGRCIYCMGDDVYVRNVECFPGVCSSCMGDIFGVKLVHCGEQKGRGIAALRLIPRGTALFEYEGELLTHAQVVERHGQMSHAHAPYVAFIANKTSASPLELYVDASKLRCIAAFLNHSAESPNCELRRIRGRLWICALENITAGDELTYTYGQVEFEVVETTRTENPQAAKVDMNQPAALILPEERVTTSS